ncbi:isocitrate dehydrogenase (NADP(+)) [Candidatus Bathyarchaeota archaeon]|nr:isocitrate dehydrogenase (NADP(+)) [Candidatus Bathyarchaeota archaeon]
MQIKVSDGKVESPDEPIIPVILGDGIGPEVVTVAREVIDSAVYKAYGEGRAIRWKEVLAGESAFRVMGEWLPRETLEALREYKVSLKGPLTTPVGEGIRSLNVAIRKNLDLYACVRPCRWIPGVPTPVKRPEALDVVIFRENTEDVYAGVEWAAGSEEAQRIRGFLERCMGVSVSEDAGLGLKVISRRATERLVRAAIRYAITNGRRSVTIVHKGNIMKYTEGAFVKWAYELAEREFSDLIVAEKDLTGKTPLDEDKIVFKDRMADSMFQQILLKPEEYDVIVTPNLNGDYLSDACAAQIGGIGLAPGANINFETGVAVFEPTHGSAPKYAGLDRANPTAAILSGAMMLEYIGWVEAATLVREAIKKTIMQKKVTADLARLIDGSVTLTCSEFGKTVVQNL